jgi:type II secretory pathway pseudopilin PulG
MNHHREAGLTRVETLVGLAIFGVLIFVIIPALFDAIVNQHGHVGTQVLSYMKQLQFATRQMVLDGEATGDKGLGWPGDTGGTFTNWTRQLVPAYMPAYDFCKLLSGPGRIVTPSMFPPKMSDGAVIVYAVSSNSPPETVLFSSANFTNSPTGGAPLLKAAKPFGKRGFVVFRKGGDGAILMKDQVGKTNLIGAYAPPVK